MAFCLVNGAEEMLAIDRLVQQVLITISAIASCAGTMPLKPDAQAKPVVTANSFAGASGFNASHGRSYDNGRFHGKHLGGKPPPQTPEVV